MCDRFFGSRLAPTARAVFLFPRQKLELPWTSHISLWLFRWRTQSHLFSSSALTCQVLLIEVNQIRTSSFNAKVFDSSKVFEWFVCFALIASCVAFVFCQSWPSLALGKAIVNQFDVHHVWDVTFWKTWKVRLSCFPWNFLIVPTAWSLGAAATESAVGPERVVLASAWKLTVVTVASVGRLPQNSHKIWGWVWIFMLFLELDAWNRINLLRRGRLSCCSLSLRFDLLSLVVFTEKVVVH